MSLRSSLAMGSVTPLTLAVMGALPSSPPREVWATASSSCWTFSRMNTCQSGEKQVRRSPFTWQVIAVCHTGAIDLLVFVGVDTSEPETLLRVWILSETHILQWSQTFCFPADETSFEAGVKVQIHSQDEPSFIDQLGFGVAPGFQTFVSCQEQRVQTVAY